MPVSSTRRQRIRLSAADTVVLHFTSAPYGEVTVLDIVLRDAAGLPDPLQLVMTLAVGPGDAPLAQTAAAAAIGGETYRLTFDPAAFPDLDEGAYYNANIWLRDAGGTSVLLAKGRIEILSTVEPSWGGPVGPPPQPTPTFDDTDITMDDTSVTMDQGV